MVHKHHNHMCFYTQHFEPQIVQDEVLYKCCLLLFEDPALEAQPRHKVAVDVGQNLSPGRNTVGPGACFRGGPSGISPSEPRPPPQTGPPANSEQGGEGNWLGGCCSTNSRLRKYLPSSWNNNGVM